MKKSDMIIAAALIVIGALIVLGPQFIFPVCDKLLVLESGKEVPMKCHWAGQSEILFGAGVLAAGVVSLFNMGRQGRRACGILSIVSSLLAILAITSVIGVCGGETMPCHMGTMPAIIVLSALGMACGIIMTAKSFRAKDIL